MPNFKNVLCAVDFAACSHAALVAAAQLVGSSGGTLTIAHVWRQPMYEGAEYPSSGDLVGAIVEDTDQALAGYVETARAHGATIVHTLLLRGEPWREIVALLETDRTFDVVVVGTHSRTGLSHIMLGSVAGKIVQHAPCSVLVMR